MDTGKILADLRKQKDWSQTDLATKSGVSREMIGKYERGEAVPSIEAAKKIADALEVSLDYLAGGELKVLDKKTLKRLQDIEKLPDNDKQNIFYTLDSLIKAAKLKAL